MAQRIRSIGGSYGGYQARRAAGPAPGGAADGDVRLLGTRRLTADENHGMHNAFVRVLGPDGRGLNGVKVILETADGRIVAEGATHDKDYPYALDPARPLPPGGDQAGWIDFPLYKDGSYRVRLADGGPAAEGLTTRLPDEGTGNTLGHFSHLAVFQAGGGAPPRPAAPAAPGADAPGTVTVQPGDSLPKLAREHLGDANRWRELYALNQAAIGPNPNLIYPGAKLRLPAAAAAAPAPGPDVTGAGERIAAYARGRAIGEPVDNGGGEAAHDWHGLVVQDYAGGADTEGRAMVVDGPRGPFLVRNGFYGAYLADRTHMALGAPLEEEHWEGDRVVQRFERGQMSWTPAGGVALKLAGAPAPATPPAPVPAPAPAPAPVPAPGVTGGDRPLSLAEYPRAHPVGAHGLPNYLQTTADADFVLDLLGRTGARNTLLIVPFPNPSELRAQDRYFLEQARARGITVQLRLGFDMKPGSDAIDPAALTRYTRQIAEVTGEGPYLQIGNEPNLYFEWADERSPDAAACARWWARYAQAVADGGGYPGLPGLAAGAWNTPDGKAKQEFEFYEQMLETVAAEAPGALDRAWTAAHPYHMYADAGHPDYVEDLHWQLGRYNELNRAVLGRSLPVLVTESGYVDGENSRRFDPGNADQARDVARFKGRLRERPDWLLVGTADWLLSNRHGGNWKGMYGPGGEGTAFSGTLEAQKGAWQDLQDTTRG